MNVKPADAVRSITGFGRAIRETPAGRLTAEIRTLNSRHLEIAVKGPRELLGLEREVRRAIRERLERGKVDVYLTLDSAPREFSLDRERAAAVAAALGELAELLGDSVRLDHVLSVGEVLRQEESVEEGELKSHVLDVVGGALDAVAAHRTEEGRALAEDLHGRIQRLVRISERITEAAAAVPSRLLSQIKDALARLELGAAVDPGRLEAEASLLAQRADVAEEVTRLRAHLASFEEGLARGGALGRRLDFLVQEIGREVNTIGSKASAGDVASLVVDFKVELEKVREQVQNLE